MGVALTSPTTRVAVSILALCIQCFSVDCLKCARCSSVHTRRCESGHVELSECTGLYQGALFCVTYWGTVYRKRVVFRDCSYVDMKTICQSQLMENTHTEVCYETCDTDGCNAASKATRGRTGGYFRVVSALVAGLSLLVSRILVL